MQRRVKTCSRNQRAPCTSSACISEPQSPHQDQDAEEGKKLLAQDKEALLNTARKGDATKVKRILAPRLTIPATLDRTLRSS